MKKFPPYSKPLVELQKAFLRPKNSLYIWIGENAWRKGTAFAKAIPERTLVLPPWLPPTDYKWPVDGCDAVIWETSFVDQSYVALLVYVLYKEGATKIISVSIDSEITLYNKDS